MIEDPTTPTKEYVPDSFIPLEFKFIHPDAKVPYRRRTTDAGYDIYAIEEKIIPPHGNANIHTGIIVVCPAGCYIVVEGRSSMWINGVAPFHGILDSGYTGELMIRLMNISDDTYHVKKHDRIAQIIIHDAKSATFKQVNESDEFSDGYNLRGTAGFGSSGR